MLFWSWSFFGFEVTEFGVNLGCFVGTGGEFGVSERDSETVEV